MSVAAGPIIPANPPRDAKGMPLKPDGSWDLDLAGEEWRRRHDREYQPKVWALIHAGWTWEMVREDSDPWQWAWRRPPRRPGKPGRRFASTDQAFNALTKERKGGE